MPKTDNKIARVRELCEQVGNAQAAGLVDEVGEGELCELVDLIGQLDQAGALGEKTTYVHVVDVFDRADGTYVFADLDDAVAFEATVNGDRNLSMGSACYRTEEVVCDHADTLKLIAAECEATPEAEASSLETGVPVATYAWKSGEDAPYSDKLECVEYTCYTTDSEEGDGQRPRKIKLWVGLDPDVGAVNIDAGRERLEDEGWQVADWAAA